jgi:hypothetical protein
MNGREFQTPFPEVNAVLEKLLTSAQAILGNQFVGMVLYGSLAWRLDTQLDIKNNTLNFIRFTLEQYHL